MTPEFPPRIEALKEELFGDDWRVSEVAYVLGLGRSTVLHYLRSGVLGGYKIGRSWRVPEAEIRKYRDALTAE